MKFGVWHKIKPCERVPSLNEPLIVTDGKDIGVVYKQMGLPLIIGTRIRKDLATHWMRLQDIPLPDPCNHPTFEGCENEIEKLQEKIKSLENKVLFMERKERAVSTMIYATK